MDFRKEKRHSAELRRPVVSNALRPRIFTQHGDDRRIEQRVKFSVSNHPVLVVHGVSFRILDISRTGVRFVGANLANMNLSSVVSAKIFFKDHGDVAIRAKVVRIVGDLIALHFDEPLSKPDITGAV
jgi:hypothetical protein